MKPNSESRMDRNGLLYELTSSLDVFAMLHQYLDACLDSILHTLDISVGLICLIQDNQVSIVGQRGLDAFVEEMACQLSRPRVCELGDQPTIIGWDPHSSSSTILRALIKQGETRALVIPIVFRNLTLGYVSVAVPDDATLNANDQAYWRTVGSILGLTVSNEQFATQLERQVRESQMLYRVSQRFVSTPDLDSLLNLIVHSAVDTIDKANNCVLHLYDETTDELVPRALSLVGQIIASHSTGRSRMHMGQGIAGYALKVGHVVNIADVDQDPRFVRIGESRSFASMLAAPLLLNERRIGTLSVDSHEPHAFSSTDARLLMTLATQAAAAIENARLVNDLQKSLTDLKATQAQLIQSEKLSAIGQLIAGVAHELNNPLTAVIGYAQLLQTSEGLDPEIANDLSRIYTQAQRAAKIVQNLLTFARQHSTVREFVDINDILDRTIELRDYQIRVENIEIVKQLDTDVFATGDPNQLQQVFLNLINNAMDSLVEQPGSGGHISVTSKHQGDTVQVRVRDDGPGISTDARKHLFEPFYTTKEVGKGTGLGLSICFGIISQHNGQIYLDETDTDGTTFVVELPAAHRPDTGRVSQPDQLLQKKGGKRVLVVDDELAIASVIERALLQNGHKVWLARNGEQALARIEERQNSGEHFDLVVCDVKMPGLSGPDLYRELSKSQPELAERTIFITGDTLSPNTQQFLDQTQVRCLTKPFTLREFREATSTFLG